ncbi:MAG: diaminopimelate epimerase [Bacteroidia bacterium]|nr:diaminopimelate epimerase [Bacteroidia bacterium]
MTVEFYKYHGSGNDFILIDNREGILGELDAEVVKNLCHRHFGIGADGLIMIENLDGYDFKMVYYNSDGNESTMCGNGGRCISHLAHKLGIIDKEAKFKAIDGDHEVKIVSDDWIELKMQDVTLIKQVGNDYEIDTGSPHYLIFGSDVAKIDIMEARQVRNNAQYKDQGINVNYVEELPGNGSIKVRTYERGVEDETLSCGTGVVASGIGTAYKNKRSGDCTYLVFTKGGELQTSFKLNEDKAEDIWLKGPAKMVYTGKLNIEAQ